MKLGKSVQKEGLSIFIMEIYLIEVLSSTYKYCRYSETGEKVTFQKFENLTSQVR